MNMPRMIVIGLAVVAAAAVAFLARALLGGGTQPVAAMTPPPEQTMEVLVASAALQPGQPLNPTFVHWQKWPKSAVDSTFITREQAPDLNVALKATVVRAPVVEGE